MIPAGSFVMGSPEEEREHKKVEVPQHRVTFRKLFMMGKYAVTFAEYDQYCASIGREDELLMAEIVMAVLDRQKAG